MTIASPATGRPRSLIIACGALARELNALRRANRLDGVDICFLPAILHNRPEQIAGAVHEAIIRARPAYRHIFCAYGDCGSGGALDAVLAAEAVERLPGPHCYSFFAGDAAFEALMDEEIGTFFLTDFLARHFERLVWRGLGLDRHPHLLADYFGHYRRVVHLVQVPDERTAALATEAATRLMLPLISRPTGLDRFAASLPQADKAWLHG